MSSSSFAASPERIPNSSFAASPERMPSSPFAASPERALSSPSGQSLVECMPSSPGFAPSPEMGLESFQKNHLSSQSHLLEIGALTLTAVEINRAIRMVGNVNCMLRRGVEGGGGTGNWLGQRMLEKPTLHSV